MYFEKCEMCGRFIGMNNYVRYAYYGSYCDIDPLPPHWICLRCWSKESVKDRQLLYSVSYEKPYIRRAGVGYVLNPETGEETPWHTGR